MRLRPLLLCLMLLAGGMMHAGFYLISNAQVLTFTEDSAIVSGFLANFSESLRAGNFYPRWMEHQLGNAGSPVFVYYSPLAYYIGAIFTWLIPAFGPEGLGPLALNIGLAMGLSSLTAFFWLKKRASINASAFIALILLLLPSQFYSMHMNISLAQLWASVWFPLGLLCAEHWREREDARFLTGLSFVLFLILFTHTPSALLFWPTLTIYALFYRSPHLKTVTELFLSALLALGLAGLYLWPCLANWSEVGMQHYLYFLCDYDALFTPPSSLFLFFIPILLFYASPSLLLACAALFFVRHDRNTIHLRRCVIIAAVIALLTFPLFLPISKIVWQHALVFHLLQSPFRLLPLLFALTPVLLLGIYLHTTRLRFIVIVALALAPGWWMAVSEYTRRREVSHSEVNQRMMHDYFDTQNMAIEYKPIWMPQTTTPAYFKTIAALPEARRVKGTGNLIMETWQDEKIQLHVSAASGLTIILRQHFFPAWQAHLDNAPLSIAPDAQGLMTLEVPAGSHDVTLSFSSLKGQKPGLILSLLSLFLLLTLWRFSKPALPR